MLRVRWYKTEWPTSVRVLAKNLRKKLFLEGAASGFILDRVRDDYLEARYIERYSYKETISDPFGGEIQVDRLEFKQVSFRASERNFGLELINPPGSARGLIVHLMEATNFEFAVSAVSVDVSKWAEEFQKRFDQKGIIDSMQLGAIEVDEGIVAKAVIRGNRDVRKAANLLSKGKKYSLEKLQFKATGEANSCSVLIASNASARIQCSDKSDEVISALRQSLTIFR